MSNDREPFYAKCVECHHVWIACYLPMVMADAARLFSGLCCPNCAAAANRIVPANKSEAKLVLSGYAEVPQNYRPKL